MESDMLDVTAEPTRCGSSVEDHIIQLLMGIQAVGGSGGCESTYEALLELADYVQKEKGFKVYQPKGLMENVMKELRMAQAMKGQPASKYTH